MSERDLRKAKREKIFSKVDIFDLKQEDKKYKIEGYIIDISTDGALIFVDLSHLLDQDVLISFEVPWLSESYRLKARVIRCDISDKGIRSGVQFIDVEESNIQPLKKLIEFIERGDFGYLI
jgi:hypothetical protein